MNGRLKLPAELRVGETLVLAIFAISPILVGLAIKSGFFLEREPVIVNYIVSSLTLGALTVYAVRYGTGLVNPTLMALATVIVLWAAFSAVESGITLNLVATGALAVLVFGFLIGPPIALYRARVEGWRAVNYAITIGTVLSLLSLTLNFGDPIDPDNGRVRGVWVSVAVACSLFGFNCFLSVREAIAAKSRVAALFWIVIAASSFYLLFMTRTRSSLAELFISLILLALFAPMRRGLRILSLSLLTISLTFSLFGLGAVSTGSVSVDDHLAEFRLADRQLTDARDGNWEFGFERIAAKPIFGEGLLAKQTQGGQSVIDFDAKTNYDPRYDPHSLGISLAVQGGLPFLFLMGGLITTILVRFVATFGLARSLQSPEFVIVVLRLSISVFSGGDMTALGNVVDKIVWLFLGLLALKTELFRRSQRSGARLESRLLERRPPISGGRRPPAPARETSSQEAPGRASTSTFGDMRNLPVPAGPDRSYPNPPPAPGR